MRKEAMILLLLLLCATACGPSKPKDPTLNQDYKKGTEGLVYEFIKSGPPDLVFENSDFDIASDIWNKGAYPVKEGYVTAILENAYMCISAGGSSCVEPVDSSGIAELQKQRNQKQKDLEQLINSNDLDALSGQADLERQIKELEDQIVKQSSVGTLNTALTQTLATPDSDTNYLKGKSIGSPEGTSKYITFKARTKPLDPLSAQHTSSVLLTSCYSYMTELSPDFCLDPDTSATSRTTKACAMKDASFSNQGAPVAITKVETKMLPENDYAIPQLIIYTQNVGKGKVINRDKLKQACSAASLGYSDWDVVTLTELRLGDKYVYQYGADGPSRSNTMSCKPNPFRIRAGDSFIRCTAEGNAEKMRRTDPAYVAHAFIRLEYGYQQSVSKKVIVEKITR
jgi:hypothetical protein